MSISKSRLPKSQRTARELEDELLPDPTDYFASARYIDRRAELGDFRGKGKPASALAVLHYLWRHTARSETGRGLGPDEARGWVLSGKCPIGKIADECNISYNTARAAIEWLLANDWIDGWGNEGFSHHIRVRMDEVGHKARLAILEGTVPTVGTATPDRANGCHTTVPIIEETVPTVGTAPCQRLADSTGTTQGSNKDFYSEPRTEEQDQNQDPVPGETPLERAKRRREANDRLVQEYADRFHDGNMFRARRHAYDRTDGRDDSIFRFMRDALA